MTWQGLGVASPIMAGACSNGKRKVGRLET